MQFSPVSVLVLRCTRRLVFTLGSRFAPSRTMASSVGRLSYPSFRKDDAADTLHGVRVADPYRYLEEPDSEETKEFVASQNSVTRAYFSGFSAKRDAYRSRLEELQNFERVSAPFRRGAHAYVYHNPGLKNQDVLLRLPAGADEGAAAAPGMLDGATPFLDLNARFPDGTTSLGSTSFSEDGKLFAYGLCKGGSDWQTIHIKSAETGEDLPEALQWVKFSSIAWTHDNAGFFYTRFPPPAATGTDKAGTETKATEYCSVFYHTVGTPQEADLLVYANPAHPVWLYGLEVTDDGSYLVMTTRKGTDPVNRVYVASLGAPWAAWRAAAKPAPVAPGWLPPAQDSGDASYLPFIRLIDNFEAEYDLVQSDGARFYFKTNLHAPRYRIVALDLPADGASASASAPGGAAAGGAGAAVAGSVDAPTPAVFDVVRESAEDVLDWAAPVAGDKVVLCYMSHVVNVLRAVRMPPASALPALTSPDAAVLPASVHAELPLPAPGTIAGFSGKRKIRRAFVKHVGFLSPGTTLAIDFADAPAFGGAGADAAAAASAAPTGAPSASLGIFYETRVPGFTPSDFEAVQHFVPSKDGTVKIPLFVVRKKVSPAAGAAGAGAEAATTPAPTLLYGYGGFNVSLQPNFSAMRLLWLNEVGGTYCLSCLRGGAEYGEAWHQAGQRLNKQNVFDDFASCAEYLIAKGISAPRKIAIMGGSNGGLLTLACAQQRPELYGAAISQVPVADMLRFHLFTVGRLWCGEYGFAESDERDFKNLLGYSPLHTVKSPESEEKQLPSILITTADHDDRVSPLHSLKMIATLQEIAGASPHQRRPLLARIEEKAGHGAGKPTAKVLDELADIYSFLAHELA